MKYVEQIGIESAIIEIARICERVKSCNNCPLAWLCDRMDVELPRILKENIENNRKRTKNS